MRRLVVFILLFSPAPLASSMRVDRWIAWNVGQGSWITAARALSCLHFDAGGERWPLREIEKLCARREQRIFLSHADLDHVGGLSKLPESACIAAAPREIKISNRKRRLWDLRPRCDFPEEVFEAGGFSPTKNSNGASRVFVFDRKFLMPGDSPSSREKIWRFALGRAAPQIRVLMLGHHGSRTSTSRELLQTLKGVRIAIASARTKKYGHPHAEVRQRLKNFGVRLLRTEDWGSLVFEL